jgi:hypothetical protein
MARPKKIDVKKEIRRLARERVGTVPSVKVVTSRKDRKKPKYKRPAGAEEHEE